MERNNRKEWFRDAKYGMFIHWGLYAELGGVWNGQEFKSATEWIMKNAQIPLVEYKKLVERFNPTKFDAREWVAKAVEYGAKYLCFTAKHHDGFCMYNTQVSDYNIMNTPFGRDVVKELAEACNEAGITFCLYYSQMQDWEDPNGDGNTWDFQKENKDFRVYFENKVKPQVKELLTNYGKIGMLWFDTPYDMPYELCLELRDFVYSLQPDCLINGRIGYNLGDFREMGDNDIPVLGFHRDWETPMTLNNTWGYSRIDENWKSPQKVMKLLTEVAGKGGNLLLNVGPDADGRIPEGSDRIMRIIGEWLKINGESIYGTRRCIDFPYQIRWGGLTGKGSTLYMHVMDVSEHTSEIKICNLETPVKRVSLLATGEELKFFQSYEIARDEYRFRVVTKDIKWDSLNTVIKVELEEEPAVHSLYMDTEQILSYKPRY